MKVLWNMCGGEQDEGDTDSLDIKPPQAQHREIIYRKSTKDKKHSREHKHKDRDRDRNARSTSGSGYRDKNEKLRHRHENFSNASSGRGSGGRDMKYEIHDRNDGRHSHRMRDYEYNQHHRHKTQQHRDHKQRMEPPLSLPPRDTRENNRKYIEHPPKPVVDAAERELEDLRSRLLSKRNKYEQQSNARYNIEESEQRYDPNNILRNTSYSYDHQHSRSTSREHRTEKRREHVIELIDSPEHAADYKQSNQRTKSPDDPEQTARRTKLLEAEREMAKRKEVSRRELEARRELRKGREDDESDTVSLTESTDNKFVVPSKRHHSAAVDLKKEQHRKKKSKKDNNSPIEIIHYDENPVEVSDDDDQSEYSSGDEEIDDSVEEEEEESEESESPSSIASFKESSKKRKKRKILEHAEEMDDNDDDDNDNHEFHESPLSIGDLSKNIYPRKNSRSSTSLSSHSQQNKSPPLKSSRSKSPSVERGLYTRSSSRSRSKSPISFNETQNKNVENNDDVDMKNIQIDVQNKTDEDQKTSTVVAVDEKGVTLPNYYPGIQGCRSVEEFQCLNRIEEGTYGVVYRAKDKRTNEIVALKRLKMEKEKEGFPITSLREINTLLKGQHPNIVTVREIVVGSNMDKIFIVMDYVEHDLKSLMETMKHKEQSFFPGEVKCLIEQLLKAVGHLHDNWILHRDLKTSNLLLSHKGILKVGDFGLAREYGSPLKAYTSLVVTLWYRAPELLLCTKEYSTPIDMWSVGCIFAEFLQMTAMFPGKAEIDQLNRIFKELGTPNEKIWPGYKDLPAVQNFLSQNSHFTEYPVSNLRRKFINKTTELGIALLQGMLTYDPKQRLTAEKALKHSYFNEMPLPIDPSMFPTWPAKSELGARKALASSPKPPSGGSQFKQLARDELTTTNTTNNSKNPNASAAIKNTGFVLNAGMDQRQMSMGPGFSLKF